MKGSKIKEIMESNATTLNKYVLGMDFDGISSETKHNERMELRSKLLVLLGDCRSKGNDHKNLSWVRVLMRLFLHLCEAFLE